MKKSAVIIVFLLFFFVGSAVLAFSQEKDTDDIEWKKIASASYGLNFGFFGLEYEDADGNEQTDTLLMPGIELRHFNGTNVPRSGGFYYGYELGLTINSYLGDHSFTAGTVDCTLSDLIAFSVIAMVKHGYKFKLADDNSGPGLGLELGMGIMAGGGHIQITEDNDKDKTNIAEMSGEPVGPVFELGIEGSLPRDEKSRFVARLSIMAGGPAIETEGFGSMAPIRISLRGGFTMNH